MYYDRTDYINRSSSIEKELKILFPTTGPLILFDIGACEGEDSIKYARLFPNSRIFSFEPLPENIKLIEKNFSDYKICNASYYNLALSSQDGFMDFYVSSGRPDSEMAADWDFGNKSSSLLAPGIDSKMPEFIQFNKRIKVETLTLHSFCKNNEIHNIDFIHLDVQGAEMMVLKGAGKFLSRVKAIWLEVSSEPFYHGQPLVGDIHQFMRENNFVLIRDDLSGTQGDHLYISKAFFPIWKIRCMLLLLDGQNLSKRILRKLGFSKPQTYN